MKLFIPIAIAICILCSILCTLVYGESGCPPPENLSPCRCYYSSITYLECSNIYDDSDLRKVFKNSEGYSFRQVHILYSTLKSLPHEMFKSTGVKELYLQNSTLNSLFDAPPEELENLYKLHLELTKINELSNWNLFKPLTNLKMLTIFYNKVEVLDSSFDENLTNDLEHIMFYGTKTKKIEPGALTAFTKLERLSIDGCLLTELTRDLFPVPFNVRHLYFNDNRISKIPDDLFTNMPNLQTLSLNRNQLTTLPESAFDGQLSSISYVNFAENPLRCDCKILWIIKKKPMLLKGSCATPIRLHDKELMDLVPENFKC